jgi:hypothetical protein
MNQLVPQNILRYIRGCRYNWVRLNFYTIFGVFYSSVCVIIGLLECDDLCSVNWLQTLRIQSSPSSVLKTEAIGSSETVVTTHLTAVTAFLKTVTINQRVLCSLVGSISNIRCVLIVLQASSSSIYTSHETVNTVGSQKHGVKGNELGCNLESVSVFP